MRRSAVAVAFALALIPLAIFARANIERGPDGSAHEPELAQAMSHLFPEDRCIPPRVALQIVEDALLTADHDGWVVRVLPGGQNSPCNSAAVDGPNRWILLAPASLPTVAKALSELRIDALRECLERDEITARVSTILAQYGQADYEIRDGGPITFPAEGARSIDELREDVLAHFEDGCVMFSGNTWAENGTAIYYLAGKGN